MVKADGMVFSSAFPTKTTWNLCPCTYGSMSLLKSSSGCLKPLSLQAALPSVGEVRAIHRQEVYFNRDSLSPH